jgi:hypothetical protein
MSIVWAGQRFEIPGLTTRSYLDPLGPPQSRNVYTEQRGAPGEYNPALVQPITGLVWHSTQGTATGAISSGPCINERSAIAIAKDFDRASRNASTTFVIAESGLVLNLSDLVWARCWGAGLWNPFVIQTELDQSSRTELCANTINAGVRLAWWLTLACGLQPMCPVHPDGSPDLGDIPQLQGDAARDFRGSYYHAAQDVRGSGDPGPAFGRALVAAGFEGFDLRSGQDRDVWRARQQWLGLPPDLCDGIAGQHTRDALVHKLGRPTWVLPPAKPSVRGSQGLGVGVWLLGLLAALAAAAGGSRRGR